MWEICSFLQKSKISLISAQSFAAIAPQFKGDLLSYLLVSHFIWKPLTILIFAFLYLACRCLSLLSSRQAWWSTLSLARSWGRRPWTHYWPPCNLSTCETHFKICMVCKCPLIFILAEKWRVWIIQFLTEKKSISLDPWPECVKLVEICKFELCSWKIVSNKFLWSVDFLKYPQAWKLVGCNVCEGI